MLVQSAKDRESHEEYNLQTTVEQKKPKHHGEYKQFNIDRKCSERGQLGRKFGNSKYM